MGLRKTGSFALNFALSQYILSPEEVEELSKLRRIRNSVVQDADTDVSLTDALNRTGLDLTTHAGNGKEFSTTHGTRAHATVNLQRGRHGRLARTGAGTRGGPQ
jgi:hypothetical protein